MDGSRPHQPPEDRINYRLSPILTLVILGLFVTTGCSVKKFVAKRVGNVFSNSGTVYASDDDIELVGSAIPFGLKTIESLLAEVPEHYDLLIAAARGFTQYAYAYVATTFARWSYAILGLSRTLGRIRTLHLLILRLSTCLNFIGWRFRGVRRSLWTNKIWTWLPICTLSSR